MPILTIFESIWWWLENGYFFADGLPDASSRKIASGLMVTAIKTNNFQDKKYGFTYWTDTAFASPMKNRRIPAQSGIFKQSLGFFLSLGIWGQRDRKIERQKDRKTKG